MTLFYDIIFLIYIAIYLPVAWFKGKWHAGLNERWGNFSSDVFEKVSAHKNIWVHAVSVGEVNVIVNIIGLLREKYPGYQIVCSTVTASGYQLAKQRLANLAVVIYAPLDLSWVVRRYIKTIKPQVYLSTETEIWPNTYTLLHDHQVPIIQINGRISDKSFRHYQLIKFLIQGVLKFVHVFCMQTRLDADRIIHLGAPVDRVEVVGNLKFDQRPRFGRLSREEMGYESVQPVLLAGSTHPGEEKIILDSYVSALKEFPDLRLIIAPRHVERTEDVLRVVRDHGCKTVLFSQIQGHKVHDQVMVVDTIGHLASLYEIADIVFIGKSLVPGGGQNMIEPAWFAKPIIVGKHTENFKDITQLFLREQAIRQVAYPEQFEDALVMLLKNPQDALAMGEKAKNVCLQNLGATEKTMATISKVLH